MGLKGFLVSTPEGGYSYAFEGESEGKRRIGALSAQDKGSNGKIVTPTAGEARPDQ